VKYAVSSRPTPSADAAGAEGADVLRQAAAAEPESGRQEPPADPGVVPEGVQVLNPFLA
jgi:hypothetical protein